MGYVRPNPLRGLAGVLLIACHSDANAPLPEATGFIRIAVSITGADPAPRYEVVVSGRTTSASRDAVTTIADLPPGDHPVRLQLPANCEIAGANPRRVTVVAHDTTAVEFSAVCAATRGWVRVTTATTGVNIDSNGYTVRVVGSAGDFYHETSAIGTAETVTFAGVRPQAVQVTLLGLAVHCDAAGVNPRTVLVVAGDTVEVRFDAVCAAAIDQLAYVVASPNARGDLHIVNADGSGNTRLTTGQHSESPSWSPDGSRIAFTSSRDGNREIYVIDANGTNARRLTNSATADYRPAWSPGGGQIAFVSERDGNAEIYVMSADGTNPVRLTSHEAGDTDPAWSPDGRRIAFTSERGGEAVYVMDVTGSDPVRVTEMGSRHPAWSPDGTSLSYSATVCPWYGYVCYAGLFIKVGSGTPVILEPVSGERPAWSRDGRKIAYNAFNCDFYLTSCDPVGFQIVRVDGTEIVGAVTIGHSPAWRP